MKKLTKRIAVTASSVAVAGVAVLGAGGTASAATPASTHVHRPAVGAKAADYHWDHGVGYLLEQGYSCDGIRGWHQDHHGTDSTRHDCDDLFYRDGHFYRWEGEGHGWKSGRSYQHDWNRSEHIGWNGEHHNRNHGGW
ncbi:MULTISPECIES: hypothetical protein [unclassified Streptomyces]|uniref:hypothetical protein n=1 Tax=unclassified Streptomyces TaxID=2593676 RepID=UPI002254AB1D|nr:MULTISPECIES: hypothetical protein [unclassified Streptomyces]MCX4649359.1 hypothetical protein [Streptomyces sp. NBC_01446]MCX5321442.1 hypothetical protein [Streptomyces sp. NBC_00120]